MSTVLPTGRETPSASWLGSPVAPLLPALTAGEPAVRCRSEGGPANCGAAWMPCVSWPVFAVNVASVVYLVPAQSMKTVFDPSGADWKSRS